MDSVENKLTGVLPDSSKLKWIYFASALFIGINTFLIAREFYWFTLLPAVLFILLLSVIALDKVLLLIVFLTPLSYTLKTSDVGAALSVPTEPLLFGTMMLFFFRLLYEGKFDKKISHHPITIAIYFYLAWMFITTMTSTMPLVSFKFLISKL